MSEQQTGTVTTPAFQHAVQLSLEQVALLWHDLQNALAAAVELHREAKKNGTQPNIPEVAATITVTVPPVTWKNVQLPAGEKAPQAPIVVQPVVNISLPELVSNISMPEGPAPVVNVTTPTTTRRVVRDSDGKIVKLVEEPE